MNTTAPVQGGRYTGFTYTVSPSAGGKWEFECYCGHVSADYDTDDEAHAAAISHINRYLNQKAYRS